jgi:hypothetical protein
MAIAREGDRLATWSFSGRLELLSARDGSRIAEVTLPHPANTAAFLPGGELAVSGPGLVYVAADGSVRRDASVSEHIGGQVWLLGDRGPLGVAGVDELDRPTLVLFSSSISTPASSGAFAAVAGARLTSCEAGGPLVDLGFGPGGDFITSANRSGEVRIWRPSD